MKYEAIVQDTLNTLKTLGADHAEVTLTESDDFEVSGYVNELGLVRSMENAVLRVTVIKDQKKASTVLNDFSNDSRMPALEALMTAVAVAEPDEAYTLSKISEPHQIAVGTLLTSDEAKTQSYKQLTQMTHEFVKTANEKFPKVLLSEFMMSYNYKNIMLKNTHGTELREQNGKFEVMSLFNATDANKSSSFNYAVTAPINLDKPFIENLYWLETLERNEKELDTVPFTGRLEKNVILTPSCFAELLSGIESLALTDSSFIQNFSKWQNALDQQVCDTKLTWKSEPLSPLVGSGYGITSDGYPAENVTVIDKGILKSFLLSDYAANKTGRKRAGNQGGIYIVDPGTTSFADMIASIDKGLLISRLSGGSPSPNGDFSGIAKNSFLIEKGQVTEAISEAMATFNLFELLADIDSLSSERYDSGSYNVPYLKSHKILVTGK